MVGEASVPALFTAQAAATPEATAVRGGDERLTYAALDEHSGRLAAHLRELGVTAEQPVGVLLDRSPSLVVALLAVLRAGGCYLALDSSWPPARTAALLADAGARVVLTQSSRRDALQEQALGTGRIAVALDDPALTLPEPGPDAPVFPDALAYIAYTSGSTGTPKGVCVPHDAVVRLVRDADFLPVSREDVFLQYAPVAFDASTLEIWAPLLNGAPLVVAPPGELTPRELAEVVRAESVSVLWLTAGLFHQVVDAGLDALRGLRYLIAGGDVLSPPQVKRAVTGLPGTTVVNGYGPTENTTFTCCQPMTSPPATPTVPIGRPISGTSVRLLDAGLEPVADGETGELYATGRGLARGYLGRPAATAEAFRPDPFGPPGSRMYRTGDLAHRLPTGELMFSGRVDEQVKVRGFRVEPGEVEAALLRQPDITQAVVAAQPHTHGGRRLAAFYTSPFAVGAAALRRALTAELPSHLVPSSFTQLDTMPLTANGKIDRAALAARPVRHRPELDNAYRRPSGPVESWLVQLWADVLEIEPVGVDDDFFELGGHSLLASQITSEIGTEFGVLLRAQTFYENPSIAELAPRLAEMREGRQR